MYFCQIRLGKILVKWARRKNLRHCKNYFLNSARFCLHQEKNLSKKNYFWKALRRGVARKFCFAANRFRTEKKMHCPFFLFCKSRFFSSKDNLPAKNFLQERKSAARWKIFFLPPSRPNLARGLQKTFCVRPQDEAFGRDWVLLRSIWFSARFSASCKFPTFSKIGISENVGSAAFAKCIKRQKSFFW